MNIIIQVLSMLIDLVKHLEGVCENLFLTTE
ncbi:MAG: hypothetical protein H6Q59_1861 [Firmicutes bacterium]|nr:hypothetical protein [Bacillota bacterium]